MPAARRPRARLAPGRLAGAAAQLGRDVFARGAAEDADGGAAPAALFRACLAVLERGAGCGTYRPEPLLLWRVPDALARLRRLLPAVPREGAALESFLPEVVDEDPDSQMRRRSALASTLLAGLELEREGMAVMDQDGAFGPVRVAPVRNAHAVRPSVGVHSEARG
jgi:segregation and condensation protein A